MSDHICADLPQHNALYPDIAVSVDFVLDFILGHGSFDREIPNWFSGCSIAALLT